MTEIEIRETLTRLKSAYQKAVEATSYEINLGGTARKISRNAPEKLLSQIQYWERELHKITENPSATGIPMRFVTPIGN